MDLIEINSDVLSTKAHFSVFRRPDNGYGRSIASKSDLWSTAEIIILDQYISIATDKEIRSSLKYVFENQNDDGGWGEYKGRSDTTATTLVLISLLSHDKFTSEKDIINKIEIALEWLHTNQNTDGGWPLIPDAARVQASVMFPTVHAYEAIAAWLLRDVGSSATANKMLTLARGFINRSQIRKSAWGLTLDGDEPTVRHTAYVLLASKSEHLTGSPYGGFLSDSASRAACDWLISKQESNTAAWGESLGGDVESTAAAIRALLACGFLASSSPVVRGARALAGFGRETKDAGKSIFGWSNRSGGGVSLWATFYATRALVDYKQAYRKEVISKVSLPRYRYFLFTIFTIISLSALSSYIFDLSLFFGDDYRNKFKLYISLFGSFASILSIYPLLSRIARNLNVRRWGI